MNTNITIKLAGMERSEKIRLTPQRFSGILWRSSKKGIINMFSKATTKVTKATKVVVKTTSVGLSSLVLC